MKTIYRIVCKSDIPTISGNETLVQLGGEFSNKDEAEEICLNYEWIGKEVWIQSRQVTEWV